jgi:hypothetical protein
MKDHKRTRHSKRRFEMSTVKKTRRLWWENISLNAQIDAIGWAILFIFSGTLLLLPEGFVPEGTWLTGVGLILVGENAFRYLSGLKLDAFSTPLGLVALGTGLGEVVFKVGLFFPVLFLVIGVSIFLGLFKRDEEELFAEMGEWCFGSEEI